MGESEVRFGSRGSNLESVDSTGFFKIARNDPDIGIVSKYYGLIA